jgi:hypothetical protein
MSALSAARSSSSRSMRLMKALSWSLAKAVLDMSETFGFLKSGGP